MRFGRSLSDVYTKSLLAFQYRSDRISNEWTYLVTFEFTFGFELTFGFGLTTLDDDVFSV